MDFVETALVGRDGTGQDNNVWGGGTFLSTTPFGRVRVRGKFLSRGGPSVRIRGVTYGPFPPQPTGERFPDPGQVARDFQSMRRLGFNAIRTYHVPPEWLFRQAEESQISILVDVPWPKHVCFLESKQIQSEARRLVRDAAERGLGHASLLAYSIGNEIPPNIVRWHSARRVQRFVRELADVAKQADPEALVTYANYPSTEYLDLSFLDIITFNVYLHDPETFRRYLLRLHNLVGDKPLMLGELGMDTLR